MFSKDAIELRVVNGDGGAWTQQKQSSDCICVLDEFHRNKKLKEYEPRRHRHPARAVSVLQEDDPEMGVYQDVQAYPYDSDYPLFRK